jgi:hypothetical protein
MVDFLKSEVKEYFINIEQRLFILEVILLPVFGIQS